MSLMVFALNSYVGLRPLLETWNTVPLHGHFISFGLNDKLEKVQRLFH